MKKNFLKFIILISLFLIFPIEVRAQTDPGYVIEDFNSEVTINQDTTVTVKETIKVNFLESRHGIYRVVPVRYTYKGQTIDSRFNLISITDEYGAPYNFERSRTAQSVKLKIGDADKFVAGPTTYEITYQVRDILRQYDGGYELYWNLTGSEWDAKIASASAKVISDYAAITKTDCFAGLVGTDQKNCSSQLEDDSAMFGSTSALGPGQDMSVVVGLSAQNDLLLPSLVEKNVNSIFSNWGYLLSVVPFGIIFYFWYKKGRDTRYVSDNYYYEPKNKATKSAPIFERKLIPLVYHPINDLSPSQVGTIADERVDMSDVVAEILELARLKHIKIEKIDRKLAKDDYVFVDLGNDRSELKNYQKYLLDSIFSTTSIDKVSRYYKNKPAREKQLLLNAEQGGVVFLSDLKDKFYSNLKKFKEKLYKNMADEGYFDGKPDSVRLTWIGALIALNTIAFTILVFFASLTANPVPILLLILLAIPSVAFSVAMPKRTARGYALNTQIRGLKDYLKRSKWRHEVYEKRLFIEEMLPLAVSLGVVSQLARDMDDLGIAPPAYMNGFTAASFSSDIGSFHSKAASNLSHTPSGSSSWSGGSGFSSGGGFSGGGFGGGGGGSW